MGLTFAGITPSAVLTLADWMIRREGIGDLLADGSRKAAERIQASRGVSVDQYAIHAGGQELAMHDGRNDPGFALHAVVEPMPGRHTNGSQLYYEMFQLWTRVPGLPKVKALYSKQEKYLATAGSGRGSGGMQPLQPGDQWRGSVPVWSLYGGLAHAPSLNGSMLPQDGITPPKDIFRQARGFRPSNSCLMPVRALLCAMPSTRAHLECPSLPHGANRGVTLEIDRMVRSYWSASGWDADTGMPTVETLEQLGLPASDPVN